MLGHFWVVLSYGEWDAPLIPCMNMDVVYNTITHYTIQYTKYPYYIRPMGYMCFSIGGLRILQIALALSYLSKKSVYVFYETKYLH